VYELSESRRAALEVMLLLAEADARWWNYQGAVDLIDAAARSAGGLPPEYELKRARWIRLRDIRRTRPQAWSRKAA
jgi:hypothetical protein